MGFWVWNRWQFVMWTVAVPSAFAFVVAYDYARAILIGIAAARDDQHRMTQESPWYFFDRIFKPRERRLTLAMLPWIMVGNIASWWPTWHGPWHYETPTLEVQLFIVFYFAMLGITLMAMAIINLSAPKFKRPLSLALASVLPGIGILFAVAFTISNNTSAYFDAKLFAIIFIFGLSIYITSWHQARRRLDASWFRLYDDVT